MVVVVKQSDIQSQNMVTTDATGVVVIVFRGKQSGESVRRVVELTRAHITQLRNQGKKVFALVNIIEIELSAADSAGRAEAKSLMNLDYDAAAVIGPGRFRLFMSYLLRGLAQGRHVQFFTRERQARAWLGKAEHGETPRMTVSKFGRVGWLFVTLFILVQAATFFMWHQAVKRNELESQQIFSINVEEINALTKTRLRVYTDALHGFKGLFRSSDFVSKNDFSNYYASLDLEKNYPGLRSVAFIAAVDDKDLNKFVAKMREEGVTAEDGKPFEIKSKTNEPTHFIFTYLAAGSSPNVGLDIGSTPGRQQIYTEALASKDIYASGILDFNATATQPTQQGFFITTSVVNALSPEQPLGIVNAVFNYSDFFNNLFDGSHVLDDLDVYFTDSVSGTSVYVSDKARGDIKYSQTVTIPVANTSWELKTDASNGYGLSTIEKRTPLRLFIAGQIIAVFLLILFVLQRRARRQAFELANTITQDLRHERNLAVANDRKSNAILSSIGDAVLSIDAAGRITVFNPAAQMISGVSEAYALNRPYKEVLKFEFRGTGEINDLFVNEALAGRAARMAGNTVLVRFDGKRVPVANSAAPIRDSHNTIVGAIIVFRDVAQDYELDRAKNEFVSLASHQLRTPLSAINWYGELLLNGDAGPLNEVQHEYVKEISEGSQRMVDLVNALLDVSRIEVGKLVDQPAPTSINELLESLEKELAPSIKSKNLVYFKHVDKIPPVVADPKQLRMVIQNILSNAVKYTPDRGTITVTLRQATLADQTAARLNASVPRWLFSVKDNGYGIPKTQQANIFGKLYRADNVRKLDVEGTGLGLYIVKQVVGKLGGRVWFDSTESIGTTFYVVMPFNKLSPKADGTMGNEQAQGGQ